MAPPPGIMNNKLNGESATVISLAEGITPPDTTVLTTLLQTTLELNELLQLFSTGIQEILPHDGIIFRQGSEGSVIRSGRAARHRCAYQLTLEQDDLGEIILTRDERRFAEQELAQLEFLLCALLYPLRNALRYRDALAAAYRDPLTGIGNRGAMEMALKREVELSVRQQIPLSLITIDIDHFKRINDTYGHGTGDCVLKHVVESILTPVRASDVVFRFGGEEFVVLLAGTDAEGARQVAERIRQSVANQPCMCDGRTIHTTISLGVSALRGHDASDLFDRGDHALYEAKRSGRNQVVVAAS